MIQLHRILDTSFPPNFTNSTKIDWEKELMENQRFIKQKKIEKHTFNTNRWKDSKEQLKKESNNKCAYCEVDFSMVAYGDVEHYRPKSKYWWLAYSYNNYLPSCQLCNQLYKSDKFPYTGKKFRGPYIRKKTTESYIDNKKGNLAPDLINPTSGLPMNDFITLHTKERPLIINPYFDDPADYFAYEIDDVLYEIQTVALDPSKEVFLKKAEEIYGINRQELKRGRFYVAFGYRVARFALNIPNLTATQKQVFQNLINLALAPVSPFAGMIRYFQTLSSLPNPPELDPAILDPFGQAIS